MKKVVTLGGGTGNFVILSSLKNYNLDLSAIVSMADDGGSTGVLRDELGVLPPGDVRQCLVALSDSGRLMRNLMNYRFVNGGLQGHSFGNLLLSALEKVTGSFEKAVEETGKILSIKGKVLPITTNPVRLKMILNSGKVLEGEGEIYTSQEIEQGVRNIYLEPIPKVNQRALDEILNADLIILGPGGLHSTLIPILLVEGVADALKNSKAKKVFIANLMNRKGQTTNYKLSTYLDELKHYFGEDIFDNIIVNNNLPPQELVDVYAGEGELVPNDLSSEKIISADLLPNELKEVQKGDQLKRSLIRHDPQKIGHILVRIIHDI